MMKKRLSELDLEWKRACRLADDRELEKLHRPHVSLVSYFNISNSGYLQFFLVPFHTVSFILHNVQNVQNKFNDDDGDSVHISLYSVLATFICAPGTGEN